MNPTGTAEHLRTLDDRWESLLSEYKAAMEVLRRATVAQLRAHATWYQNNEFTASNDAMRRQWAISHTLVEIEALHAATDEVEFKKAELRALSARVDTARSMHAGTRAATQ